MRVYIEVEGQIKGKRKKFSKQLDGEFFAMLDLAVGTLLAKFYLVI